MDELLDVAIKQEIEKISQDVKAIMKRVEAFYPSPADAQRQPSKSPEDPSVYEDGQPNSFKTAERPQSPD